MDEIDYMYNDEFKILKEGLKHLEKLREIEEIIKKRAWHSEQERSKIKEEYSKARKEWETFRDEELKKIIIKPLKNL